MNETNPNSLTKPPLGIMPENIWKQIRLDEVHSCIKRHTVAGKLVSVELIDEAIKLSSELYNYKKTNG